MGALRTIRTAVLGFLGAAALAVGVAAFVYNWPGDTQGPALIAGAIVLGIGIRTVTHWILEQIATTIKTFARTYLPVGTRRAGA
jgi:hypothetical protein